MSVVLPTYRRPEMVQRAIESVRIQTIGDWELVVSDDEEPAGETWRVLERIATGDKRIRPVRNDAPHGMVANWNNAMRHARAPWIKILHSDDVLAPHCLETLLRAVEGLDSVILVSCLASDYRDGRFLRVERRGRHPVELVPSPHARLGMYLQEVGPGPPTVVMVQRAAVDREFGLFEDLPGVVSVMDADWGMRVLAHGDLLLVNEPLVERHHGSHTTTATISEEQLDAELELLRHRYLPFLEPELPRPPLETMLGALRLIRAANRLKKRRVGDAVRIAVAVRRPRSWAIACRWLLQQLFPGRFRTLPYKPIPVRRAS